MEQDWIKRNERSEHEIDARNVEFRKNKERHTLPITKDAEGIQPNCFSCATLADRSFAKKKKKIQISHSTMYVANQL